MGRHLKLRERRERVKVWSDRFSDGRIRVQCEDCFRAGLRSTECVRTCPACQDRSARKSAEMVVFRSHLGIVVQAAGPQAAAG